MKSRKVFGIGLNKTGTKTLGRCLAELGYRHLSHRRDLLVDWFNGRLEPIFAVCDGFDSFEDWPYPLLFEQLYARYGDNGRYILTMRKTPELWLRSLKNHALTTPPTQHSRLLAYGAAYPHGLEQRHLAIYEEHARRVLDFFATNNARHLLKVLCWEGGDDWRALCNFLNEPVPDAPFPHENRQQEAVLHASAYRSENERRIRDQLELLGIPAPATLVA